MQLHEVSKGEINKMGKNRNFNQNEIVDEAVVETPAIEEVNTVVDAPVVETVVDTVVDEPKKVEPKVETKPVETKPVKADKKEEKAKKTATL